MPPTFSTKRLRRVLDITGFCIDHPVHETLKKGSRTCQRVRLTQICSIQKFYDPVSFLNKNIEPLRSFSGLISFYVLSELTRISRSNKMFYTESDPSCSLPRNFVPRTITINTSNAPFQHPDVFKAKVCIYPVSSTTIACTDHI